VADADRRVMGDDDANDYSGKDMEYKKDHIQLFDEARLVWPAPRYPTQGTHCRHLDQRAFEVVHYANSVWPYSCPLCPGVFGLQLQPLAACTRRYPLFLTLAA